MEEKSSKSNQEAIETVQKRIKPKHLSIEGSKETSLWHNCHPLTPSLGSADKEDALFVDAPHHVKVFKFNPKTHQFIFNEAIPKIFSQPTHMKYIAKGPFFDYSHSGSTLEVIMKEDQEDLFLDDLLFRRYKYKDIFKNQRNRILVEDIELKTSLSLPIETFTPIQGIPHFISHQNLFYSLKGSISCIRSLTRKPNQEYFLKDFIQTKGKITYESPYEWLEFFINQNKLSIRYAFSSESKQEKPHLFTLGSGLDHIKGLFDFKDKEEVFGVNLIN